MLTRRRNSDALAIPDFLEPYPDLSVGVNPGERQLGLVEARLRPGDPDHGITRLIAGCEGASTCRRVVCGAPGYLKRHGAPRVPEDLRTHADRRTETAHAGTGWFLFTTPCVAERPGDCEGEFMHRYPTSGHTPVVQQSNTQPN